MRVLISPISVQEAVVVANSKADIIDIKNVNEGSLGAQLPCIIKEIIQAIKLFKKEISATLGDLPYKPGTAALAALGLVQCGVNYVKAGIYGPKNFSEAFELINAIVDTVKSYNPDIKVVASAYADWRKISGLSPYVLVPAARKAHCDVVMVDTAIKDGSTLFDNMSYEEIKEFVSQAQENNMEVALAGSLKDYHIDQLIQLNPDIIGVRGAVCQAENRRSGITKHALDRFLSTVSESSYVHA